MAVSDESKELRSESSPDDKPYCQIVGREISAESCFQQQGHEGCFGCAAVTRRCEKCHDFFVDVPAVGLCSHCLRIELDVETSLGKPHFDVGFQVHCQIAGRSIDVEMCLATQGQEACHECKATSRMCEKCGQRPSRFPQYGLCLICSVAEYGEGWERDLAAKADKSVRATISAATEPTGSSESQDITKLTAQVDELRHQNSYLSARCEQLEQQIGDLRKVNEALQRGSERVCDENRELKRRLDETRRLKRVGRSSKPRFQAQQNQ